jgi:hypothetical protein
VNERQLCAAVVARTWQDAFLPPTRGSHPGDARPTETCQREARLWLTERRGAWAEARSVWCHSSGLCPDAVRDRALAAIRSAYVAPLYESFSAISSGRRVA